MTVELDPENPDYKDILAEARTFAFENKLNQQQFAGQLGLLARFLAGGQAKALALRDAEMKSIGENAGGRITAVEKYIAGSLPADQAKAVIANLTTKAALEGFEALIRRGLPAGASVAAPGASAGKGDKFEGLFGAQRRSAQLAQQKQHIRA